jgi:hypothetical protein
MAGRGGIYASRAGGFLVETVSAFTEAPLSQASFSETSRPVISSSAGLSCRLRKFKCRGQSLGPDLSFEPDPRSLNADFASFGHPDVWPIKDISPPIINLGNRSGRSDKSKPKTRFKDHVCGPAIRPTVECESWQLQTANFSDVN